MIDLRNGWIKPDDYTPQISVCAARMILSKFETKCFSSGAGQTARPVVFQAPAEGRGGRNQ